MIDDLKKDIEKQREGHRNLIIELRKLNEEKAELLQKEREITKLKDDMDVVAKQVQAVQTEVDKVTTDIGTLKENQNDNVNDNTNTSTDKHDNSKPRESYMARKSNALREKSSRD